MNYEMLTALLETNQEGNRRVYTIPKAAERWKVSQIEGMALFSLALNLSYDWYKANHLRYR
jgi:hypothetical protein